MNRCPHCDVEIPAGIIFCHHCRRNVHFRGSLIEASGEGDSSEPTAEELELRRRIGRADVVLWICGTLIVLAGVALIMALHTANSTLEGGFLGIAIMACLIYGWPVGLLLLIGVIHAVSVRFFTGRELKKLRRSKTSV